MVVWRYENEHGQGPYRNCPLDESPLREMREEHGSYSDEACVRWPLPESVSSLGRVGRDIDDLRCACDSLESLIIWFDGWHQRLREAGFSIVSYVVKRILQEPDIAGQVTFDIKDVVV